MDALLDIISLPGLTSFADAHARQLDLLDRRIRDEVPDTILFVEHYPVITRGRGLQFTGKARDRHTPAPVGLGEDGKIRISSVEGNEMTLDYAECERGGDLTYHGPGQCVGYPIIKLDGHAPWAPRHDLGIYLRQMETMIARALSLYGLKIVKRENATGVWIQTPVGDRKIASIGIAIRKWVTYHGFALNVTNDLRPNYAISPCGFSPEVMTRLADWVPAETVTRTVVEELISTAWGRVTPSEVRV